MVRSCAAVQTTSHILFYAEEKVLPDGRLVYMAVGPTTGSR